MSHKAEDMGLALMEPEELERFLTSSSQCTGIVKNGERAGEQCRKKAIAGGRVCRSHGGQLPPVQRAAQKRLETARLILQMGAVDAARELVRQANGESITDDGFPITPSQRQKASDLLLKYAGVINDSMKVEVSGHVTHDTNHSIDAIMQRLDQQRAQGAPFPAIEAEAEVIDES